MKRMLITSLLLGPCLVAAQQLDLKTGAWEITTTGGPLPKPVIEKECITKADLAQFSNGPDKDEDADCKDTKPPTIAGKTWSGEKTCPGGRKVSAQFTAETPERVKGTIAIQPGNGQKPTTVQISGKWLMASCKGIS